MTKYELWVYRADNRLVAEFNGTKICEVNNKLINPGEPFEFTQYVQPGSALPLIIRGYNEPSSASGKDNPYHFQYEVVVKFDNRTQVRIAYNEDRGDAAFAYRDYKLEKIYEHIVVAQTKPNGNGAPVEVVTCKTGSSRIEAASDGTIKQYMC